MKCGKCFAEFNGVLRLKEHQAKEHGVPNEFALGMSRAEYSRLWKLKRDGLGENPRR